VLVCRDADSSRQTDGWERAAVVTYGKVVTELLKRVAGDYRQRHPECYSFIDQMYRKFVKGKGRMQDREVLEFLAALCEAGEAGRYAKKHHEVYARQFADDVRSEDLERFDDGRELLGRLKGLLRSYCEGPLQAQLSHTFGSEFSYIVSVPYRGNFQWTVNLDVSGEPGGPDKDTLQLKFGPSAWYANEEDSYWQDPVDAEDADYSHVFLTSVESKVVRQSAVTLQEVLDGLGSDDRRLHDGLVALWRGAGT